MGKRELAALGVGKSDEGASRTRRRIDYGEGSSDVEMGNAEGVEHVMSKEEVKVLGLRLWQTVKDATKDGRSQTVHFLKQPHRRTYPDYYELIAHPIALEDIKKKLDHNQYVSLEGVRQDLELCFTNAKSYNMKDSEIYIDAKDLLKLTNKIFNKLMPDANGESGKHKPQSLNRLIKSRLQKLIAKTDDSGRILSDIFMELPSKKEWPIYYKIISHPQCLENIFKRIKRKEYESSGAFADDVELVFSNAMQFNLEHSEIWEDAVTLRDYFRTLMADLPAPFDLPQYSKSSHKIKIKMPAASSATIATTNTTSHNQHIPSNSTTLRLPPAKPAAKPPVKEETAPPPPPLPAPALQSTATSTNDRSEKPAAAPPAVASTRSKSVKQAPPPPQPATVATSTGTSTSLLAPSAPVANAMLQLAPSAPQPVVPVPTRPAAPSQPYLILDNHLAAKSSPTPIPAPAPRRVTKLQPTPEIPATAPSTSQSPAPPPPPQIRLRRVILRTIPKGRFINLDHRDGVAYWAMRLDQSEQSLCVYQVNFLDDDEDGSSGEEDGEEEDVDMEVDNASKPTRKSKRGRGRPKGSTANVKAATEPPPPKKKRGAVQVRVNGVVNDKEAESGRWIVNLTVGNNVLEVGEKGGGFWKVLLLQTSDT